MKIKVGVFFGGQSVEHEVSIISGLQAVHAMDKEKYSVIPIYIAKSGLWYTGEPLLDIDNYKDIKKMLSKCKQVSIINTGNERVIVKYPFSKFGSNIVDAIDVAFPVMHGPNGEDGTLQGYFESVKLDYASSDIAASVVGMDKVITKKVLRESQIPVIDYYWFYSEDWIKRSDEIVEAIEKEIGYPAIVKPSNIGSSIGITKVKNRVELEDAIDLARGFSAKVLVEKMVVDIREINCSVLGDRENAQASVCEEPVSSHEILTYQDKYLNNSTKGMSGATRKIPADIPQEMTQRIKSLAVDAFKAMGCSGVVRIDFIIDQSNDIIYVNEANTIPGSLAFYLWEPTGKSFAELTDDLIKLALKKGREKARLTTTYESNLLSSGGIKGLKK